MDLIGAHSIAARNDGVAAVVLCFETQIETPKHVIRTCNKGKLPRLEGFYQFDDEEDSPVADMLMPESHVEELKDEASFGDDDGV